MEDTILKEVCVLAKLTSRNKNKEKYDGKTFIGSAFEIAKNSSLEGSSLIESALIHHWLLYCTTDLLHCPTHQELYACLSYINSELRNSSYLCGFKKTIVDYVYYVILRPFIENWSYQQKEKYINISRWISTLQKEFGHTDELCIKFSRTLLY